MAANRAKVTFLIVLTVLLGAVAPAMAQEGQEDETPPCAGEAVSGTVVAADPTTGVVTLYSEVGLCTVTLDDSYDHPIVALLGRYFGDVSVEGLMEALDLTQGCAVQVDQQWTWADCGAEGALPVTLVAENEDGTFTAVAEDGTEIVLEVLEGAEALAQALERLLVDWTLEDGAVVQAGDQIAAYHRDGLGFGVLVKLYAMATTFGPSVEELVAAFQSGVGMGELFQEYGRPALMGVGHVRSGQFGYTNRFEHTNRFRHADRPQQVPPGQVNRPQHPDTPGQGSGQGQSDHSNQGNHSGRGRP